MTFPDWISGHPIKGVLDCFLLRDGNGVMALIVARKCDYPALTP